MAGTVDALILDLLEWIGPGRRPYAEVMEAWRTSCPRLPVWEEANERGFLEHSHEAGGGTFVSVSDRGKEHLRAQRPDSHLSKCR
jgi:D-3-phosphoglycerate dehydrogenase